MLLVVSLAAMWSFSGSFSGSTSGPGPTPPGAAPTPPPSVDEAHLRLNPASKTLTSGETLSLAVVLNTQGEELGGVDVYLEFDANRLSLSGLTDGGLFPAFTSNEVVPGRWRLTGNVAGPGDTGFSGENTLATVEFTAIGPGQAEISFGNGTVLSRGGQDVDPLTLGGTYTIN